MKFIILMSLSFLVVAETKLGTKNIDETKVKYKSSKRIDFQSLLIEGERKKPEMSVVVGNVGEKDNGLMVFRKDFVDTMSADYGENIK